MGKALLTAMPRTSRAEYLRDQGLAAFTSHTVTDAESLENWVRGVDPAKPVVEHGEFREGVSCAAALVPRVSVDGPVWAVVVSTRADDLPPRVGAELMRAAHDLAPA
jgi:DNA-binding IclR family transcriptional regulator